ncbi:MAG: aminotransferase class I/II-fold pyridoxal phosphate-dependent enzyme, partial [Natronospirillum sp.]
DTRGLNLECMLADLYKMGPEDAVVLHGCCHNPSGVDPTIAQWDRIGDALAASGALAFVDFAYQGFGDGVEEDAVGLRLLIKKLPEMLIANSFSKNFGLYNERVGAITAISSTPEESSAVLSQLKALIRGIYSNPPCHGAAVVSTILNDPSLTAQWHEELDAMRNRINGLRTGLVEALQAQGVAQDFSFISEQKGMFSFSGLNKEQVVKLRETYGIYMVGSGRINIAGIRKSNVKALCEAIASVL